MHVTVTKHPDGVLFMTRDGHGVILDEEMEAGDSMAFGDNTVAIVNGPSVRFSWVDYLDTSNRDVPGKGVRHTVQRSVPASVAAGPYTVEVSH